MAKFRLFFWVESLGTETGTTGVSTGREARDSIYFSAMDFLPSVPTETGFTIID